MRGLGTKKRRQHHVWQHYLKSWAVKEQIYCLSKGRIFRPNTTGVAVERDFYKLHHLTDEDIALIRLLAIQGTNPYAKQTHENFLGMLVAPMLLKEEIEKRKGGSKVLDEIFDHVMTNVLEDYHAAIEDSFAPLLERALASDINYSKENYMTLAHYICVQYLRTKGIKVRTIEIIKEKNGRDLSRAWDVMSLMFAVNVASTLFIARNQSPLYLVRNATGVPFITGDQPVINLHGNGTETDKFSLYYPLSPALALFWGDVDEKPAYSTESLCVAEVLDLNARIVRASHSQVFAQTEEALIPFVSNKQA